MSKILKFSKLVFMFSISIAVASVTTLLISSRFQRDLFVRNQFNLINFSLFVIKLTDFRDFFFIYSTSFNSYYISSSP